ncbi:MAG TPA: hypothetical protein VHA80_02920 [Solirubrobacterales bacterium]|nr:hypothetical protein [Solirubrobacterales bacterium]
MFYCERCESKFNATVAAAAGDCPRCKESDGVASKLRLRLFEPAALKVAGLRTGRTAAAAARVQPTK